MTEPESSGCGHTPHQVTILEAGRVTELCYGCAIEWCKELDYRPVSSAARQAWIDGYSNDECREIDAEHCA